MQKTRQLRTATNTTYQQVLTLVRNLPMQQKIELSKELEKDGIKSKLTHLLAVFNTDELDIETITKETETVRKKIYDNRKKH